MGAKLQQLPTEVEEVSDCIVLEQCLHATAENFVAGRLAHFADTWKLLTSDVSILKTVTCAETESDCKMQDLGSETRPQAHKFSDRQAAAIGEEIEKLLTYESHSSTNTRKEKLSPNFHPQKGWLTMHYPQPAKT